MFSHLPYPVSGSIAAPIFIILMTLAGAAMAQTGREPAPDAPMVDLASAVALGSAEDLQRGTVVRTLGFHRPGDGGAALYHIRDRAEAPEPNAADVLAVGEDLVAVLTEAEAVNYRQFGAASDGESDDGVQVKRAHEYAAEHELPIVNRSGDFWIKDTHAIPIRTSVDWGATRFHIDERFNERGQPRFVVLGDEPTITLDLDDDLKATLLERIRPGVQIIPELAPYAGHLIIVRDENDRIGVRAGYDSHQGWAREELFYVEEEGRVIGDIAWTFQDLTSVTATPCGDSYLVIDGGSFHVSGHTPESGASGYHHNGFSIQRSRTIIRNQWVGLEAGRSDETVEPRHGFYSLSGVYDVTIENVRAMPWEKDRPGDEPDVAQGTYGIGGKRMLGCTFRNVTAEAGWVAWGVFGTNLNKDLRIENCRLNRVDVHFHCWGLHIKDSEIGFKGITLTGGGELLIENTTRHGNSFVSFRRDYGSKWDGPIRIEGCTLRPVSGGGVAVLSYGMADFDYQYPIGLARSISIQDLVIDYAAEPESQAPCWLVYAPPFSRTSDGGRLFFPTSIELEDIRVAGRQQGVRLMRIPEPGGYELAREGDYNGAWLEPNCVIAVENVQLEPLTPASPGDTDSVHLLIGGDQPQEYLDDRALHPKIRFRGCEGVSAYLGNCVASATFDDCTINTLTAPDLDGELVFDGCHFRPELAEADGSIYDLSSSLGTRLTGCTIHAPMIGGQPRPDLVGQVGFLEINGPLKHAHINTSLGNDVLDYLDAEGIALERDFIDRLKLHNDLE